ncbi:hypothetical protein BX600DRAFT_18136 [Xylariales sp. PMI_506]|nr:hypothetical protein BX600DRAFT_18136 [Xylariales sp. PMI_506]
MERPNLFNLGGCRYLVYCLQYDLLALRSYWDKGVKISGSVALLIIAMEAPNRLFYHLAYQRSFYLGLLFLIF